MDNKQIDKIIGLKGLLKTPAYFINKLFKNLNNDIINLKNNIKTIGDKITNLNNSINGINDYLEIKAIEYGYDGYSYEVPFDIENNIYPYGYVNLIIKSSKPISFIGVFNYGSTYDPVVIDGYYIFKDVYMDAYNHPGISIMYEDGSTKEIIINTENICSIEISDGRINYNLRYDNTKLFEIKFPVTYETTNHPSVSIQTYGIERLNEKIYYSADCGYKFEEIDTDVKIYNILQVGDMYDPNVYYINSPYVIVRNKKLKDLINGN